MPNKDTRSGSDSNASDENEDASDKSESSLPVFTEDLDASSPAPSILFSVMSVSTETEQSGSEKLKFT